MKEKVMRFTNMKVKDLKSYLKENGIKGYSKLKKAELQDMVYDVMFEGKSPEPEKPTKKEELDVQVNKEETIKSKEIVVEEDKELIKESEQKIEEFKSRKAVSNNYNAILKPVEVDGKIYTYNLSIYKNNTKRPNLNYGMSMNSINMEEHGFNIPLYKERYDKCFNDTKTGREQKELFHKVLENRARYLQAKGETRVVIE